MEQLRFGHEFWGRSVIRRARGEAGLHPRLLVLSGPLKDSTIPLSEGEVTIGREAANGIAISRPFGFAKTLSVELARRKIPGAGPRQPQWNPGERRRGRRAVAATRRRDRHRRLFLSVSAGRREAGTGCGPGGIRGGAVHGGDHHPPSPGRGLSAARPAVARVAGDLTRGPQSERTAQDQPDRTCDSRSQRTARPVTGPDF